MTSIETETIDRARADLARRLGVDKTDIVEELSERADFPDGALGASLDDEMSAQVITPGWRIRLSAQGQSYEYRSSGNRLRLVNFRGRNYKV